MKKIFVSGLCVFVVVATIIFTKGASDVVKKVSESYMMFERVR